MEDEDLIRERMEDTRTAMTEKLETLEQKVVDTVDEATSAVTETVATVKDSIQETVSTVTDTVQGTMSAVKDSVEEGVGAVKDFFDISAHVQHYPWPMVGGSLAVGFLLGRFFGPEEPATTASQEASVRRTTGPLQTPRHAGNGGRTEKPAPKRPSLFDEFGPELSQLKGLAVGALMGAVRELALQAVPEHMGDKVRGILDSVTEKLGGNPVPPGQGLGDTTSAQASPSGTPRNVGPGFRRMADPAY